MKNETVLHLPTPITIVSFYILDATLKQRCITPLRILYKVLMNVPITIVSMEVFIELHYCHVGLIYLQWLLAFDACIIV